MKAILLATALIPSSVFHEAYTSGPITVVCDKVHHYPVLVIVEAKEPGVYKFNPTSVCALSA